MISALAKAKNVPSQNSAAGSVIPYRESKLTRLLKDSLGLNTRTILIATLSPLTECIEESISTLKFADRAKQVMIRVTANEVNTKDDAIVQKLQREVQHLKEILNMKRKGGALDIHQQLLQLKMENSRLSKENQVMQVEL